MARLLALDKHCAPSIERARGAHISHADGESSALSLHVRCSEILILPRMKPRSDAAMTPPSLEAGNKVRAHLLVRERDQHTASPQSKRRAQVCRATVPNLSFENGPTLPTRPGFPPPRREALPQTSQHLPRSQSMRRPVEPPRLVAHLAPPLKPKQCRAARPRTEDCLAL